MPNIGHRHWSWLGGVAMLLAAAAVLWGWGRPPAGVPPIAADDSSFAALRESRTPAAAAPAPDAALELRTQRHWALAGDAPLLDRLDTLRDLAAAGDREAACWLALEYSHCHTLAVIDNVGQNFGTILEHRALPGVSAKQEDDLLLGIADARERHDRSAEHCAGISEFEDNPGVPLLQAVAGQGSVRLKVVSALMQPSGNLLRLPRGAVIPLTLDTSTERLASQFYADNALHYLQLGFQARDALALEGLILIHAPDVIHLPNNTDVAFRLPNPRLFAALALLAEQVYGGAMLGPQARNLLQRTLEAMPAEQRLVVERDVQIEATRWQGAPPPPTESGQWDYSDYCR